MPIQLVDIGTIPDDGTGDPLRNAYDALNDNDLLLAGGFQTIAPFTAGVTPVVPNSNYITTLTGPVTFPALPAAADGDWISFYLNVTAPAAVNLHTNNTVYRIGGNGPLAAPINFPVGNHRLTLRQAGIRWWVEASELTAVQAADLAALHAKDAQHDAAIAALQAKDVSLDSDIANLVNKDASLDADIDALQATDVDLQTQLNSHTDQIGAIQVVNNNQQAQIDALVLEDASTDTDLAALVAMDAKLAGGWQKITPIGTVPVTLALNTNYSIFLTGSAVLPAPPAAQDGDWIGFDFIVSTFTRNVNFAGFANAVRAGYPANVITNFDFAPGVHRLRFQKQYGTTLNGWVVEDTQWVAPLNATLTGLLGGDQSMTPFTIGTTAISVNNNYQTTLSAPWTFPILPSAPDGDGISFWMNVTAQSDVNLHTNNEIYRIGHPGAGQLATPLTFPVGRHLLELRKVAGRWWFQDSIPFQAAAPPPVDLAPLYAKDAEHDASIAALQSKDATHDTAISNLQAKDSVHDSAINSLGTMDVKLAGGWQQMTLFTPGTTVTQVNKNYFATFGANYTLGALPVGADGDWISFLFSATAQIFIDVHTGNAISRIGKSGVVNAAIPFPVGNHQLMFRKANGVWWLWDNQIDIDQSSTILKLSGGWVQATAFTPNVTPLQTDTWYEGTLDGTQWTFPILPSAPDGSAMAFHMNVTAPTVVNLHTNNEVYRIGTAGQLSSTITFPVGKHNLRLRKVLARWWFDDSVLVSGQAGAIALIEADIDALQAKDVTHDNQIEALVNKDALLDADIDALQATDVDLQTQITSHTAQIDNLVLAHNDQEAEILALQDFDVQATSQINQLKDADIGHDSAIAALQAKDVTHDTMLAKLEGGWQKFQALTLPLVPNRNYHAVLNAAWAIGVLPAAQEGDWISFLFDVSSTAASVDFTGNNILRIGSEDVLGQPVHFPFGWHHMTLRRANTQWWLEDSALLPEKVAYLEQNDLQQEQILAEHTDAINTLSAGHNDQQGQIDAILAVDTSQDAMLAKLAGGWQNLTTFIRGTTVIELNKNYFVSLNGPWAIGELPSASDGDWVSFHIVASASSPVDFYQDDTNSVFRLTTTGVLTQPIVFPPGIHRFTLRKASGYWFLDDTPLLRETAAEVAADMFLGPRPALIASGASSSAVLGNVSAQNADTTGASLIVVNAVFQTGQVPVIVDTAGNTYIKLTERVGGNYNEVLFYCQNPVTSASHGIGVSQAFAMNMAAFSHISAEPILGSAGAAAGATLGVNTGNLALPARSLVITGMGHSENLGHGRRVTPGFTKIQETPYTSSPVGFGSGLAYKFAAEAATHFASWEVYEDNIIESVQASIVGFKCAKPTPAPLPAAPVLIVATQGVSTANDSVTPPVDTTGAGFIILAVSRYFQPIIFDSYGNNWNYLNSYTAPVTGWIDIYYCFNPKVGPNHTFSTSNPNSNPVIHIAAFSWMGQYQLIVGGSVPNPGTSASPVPAPLQSPSRRSMFITFLGHYNPDVISVGGEYKMITDSQYSPAVPHAGGALAYQITEDNEPKQPQWLLSSGLGGPIASMMWDASTPFVMPNLEPAAWEHWTFGAPAGTSSASILGGKSVGTLVPVATYENTGNRSIRTIPDFPGFLNGLHVPGFPDRANYTACVVVKVPYNRGGAGCEAFMVTTADMTANGSAWTVDGTLGGGFYLVSPGSTGLPLYWSPYNAQTGDWVFLACRVRAGLAGASVNGAAVSELTVPQTLSSRNVALGNAYLATQGASTALEYAEFILFDAALTDAQINAVYLRSKLRMKQAGITITSGLPNAPSTTLLASTSKGTTAAGGHTDPIDTTGAKLIVLNLAYFNSGTLTGVHDSQGNTYTPLTPHIDIGTGAVQQLWYCAAPATGAAHQIQINGATIFASVQVAAFGGELPIVISPLDQEGGGIGGGLSIEVGPIGQSTVQSLVIAGVAFSDAQPVAPGAPGYTMVGAVPYIFGQHFGSAMSFKVSDSIVLHKAHWDFVVPMSGIAAGISTFKLEDPL